MHVYTIDPSVECSYFLCVVLHFRGRKMIVPVSFCHTKSYKNADNCMMSTKCINVNGKYHFLKVLFARYFAKRSQIIKCIQQGIKKQKWKKKEKRKDVYILLYHLYMSRSTKKQQNDLCAKRRLRSAVHPPSLIIVFAWVAYSVGASFCFGTW